MILKRRLSQRQEKFLQNNLLRAKYEYK
jgi:hypothetical protein